MGVSLFWAFTKKHIINAAEADLSLVRAFYDNTCCHVRLQYKLAEQFRFWKAENIIARFDESKRSLSWYGVYSQLPV